MKSLILSISLLFLAANAFANCWQAGDLRRVCSKVQDGDCSWLGPQEKMLCEGVLQKSCNPMMGDLYYTCLYTVRGSCFGLSGDSYYFCRAISE